MKTRTRMKEKVTAPVLVWLLLILTGPGCGIIGAQDPAAVAPKLEFEKPLEWSPRFEGVDLADFKVTSPVLMRGCGARIDLQNPGIELVVTPGNGSKPGETDSLRTSSFLKITKCQLAINASPFSPVSTLEGKPLDVQGLLVNEGKIISPAQKGLPALLIAKNNQARLARPPFDLEKVHHAVGGFSIVLKDGLVTASSQKRHPRTAAGVSKDGRFLYLLVIDGRQSSHSRGATTPELALWLKKLGAFHGINLDGGGTTTMVLSDRAGKPEIVNRPVHLGIPGTERPSGAHLGVRARAIPKGERESK